MIDLLHYLNVSESVWTRDVVLRSNCVKLQNKFHESTHFYFNEIYIPVIGGGLGDINFSARLHISHDGQVLWIKWMQIFQVLPTYKISVHHTDLWVNEYNTDLWWHILTNIQLFVLSLSLSHTHTHTQNMHLFPHRKQPEVNNKRNP
jgi:hypothetical protein